jgi:hypothetical protein
VLVGYRAGDAPVRYFLNVLEADRQRFPDLHPVYALDAVNAHEEVDARWEALAVEPIAYEYDVNPETEEKNHSVLWRDLERLAEVIERPRATRRHWAQEILGKAFADADALELDRIAWLFRGQRDLWGVGIEAIKDAAWFDFFADSKLWSEEDAPWIIAAWMALDFQSTNRFQLAIGWLGILGKPFANQISRRLTQTKELSDFWIRAWRLLSISESRRDISWENSIHPIGLAQVLRGTVVLNDDLHQAVGLLSPKLELAPRDVNLYGEPAPQSPERIDQIAWARLRLREEGGASRLLDALVEFPQPNSILAIATTRIDEAVRLSFDIGDISGDYDRISFGVPSIEPHSQNEHREGPTYLIELLARVLPAAAETDPLNARRLADGWRTMPGKLGIRLWLHALCNPTLFTSNEAINGLMALTLNEFWTLRRELALVLRDRATNADADSLSLVEHRILTEGQKYYARYKVEKGQADWRTHARDTAVWLRLNMLNAAGRLSNAGTSELEAINNRRSYLAREVEDRDFFDSYSTGARLVVGDAQPIVDASDADRLEIARKAIHSPDIEKQQGWRAYCQADPNGAFDMLRQAPLDEPNALLWSELIDTLSFAKDDSNPTRNHLVVKIFSALEPATEAFLTLIINSLATLYFSAPRRTMPAVATRWPQLFAIAVDYDTVPFESSSNLIDEAINSPGGRLTQAVLIDISDRKQSGEPIGQELLSAITQAASAKGRQGVMARAILIESAGFVESINGQGITPLLDAALGGDTGEAVALRSVMVRHGRLSRPAYRAFSIHILRGVTELDSQKSPDRVAANIISPALSIVCNETDAAAWGFNLSDVAHVLRSGPQALREGAAHFLNQWITQFEGDPATAWRRYIEPLLAEVWPRERALRDRKLTLHFADLAVKVGNAFPEALDRLQPYLDVVENNRLTYTICESQVPEKFPSETLTLLWKLFGIGSTGDLHNVHQILDRVVAVQPKLEVDRRLQWLDQRAVRYE